MIQRGQTAGFTLVEMLVAISITSLLVLISGVTLISAQRAIKQQFARDDLQSDMRVALPRLYEIAREASFEEISSPSLMATGTVLSVGTNSIYRATSALVSNAAGSYLVYARGANKMALSSGWVKTFSVVHATNTISFTLELDNTNDSMRVDGKVYYRN